MSSFLVPPCVKLKNNVQQEKQPEVLLDGLLSWILLFFFKLETPVEIVFLCWWMLLHFTECQLIGGFELRNMGKEHLCE